jgi:hypothetical protein
MLIGTSGGGDYVLEHVLGALVAAGKTIRSSGRQPCSSRARRLDVRSVSDHGQAIWIGCQPHRSPSRLSVLAGVHCEARDAPPRFLFARRVAIVSR